MSETDIIGTVTADDKGRPVREFEVVELPTRGRGGRPKKLNFARFKRILEHIKNGSTIVRAARAEGITYDCLRKQVVQKPEWQTLVNQAEEVREELWKSEALEAVRSAFGKNWVSAMTFLERRWPGLYALKVVNRNINTNELVLDKVSAEQLAEDARLALEVAKQAPKLVEAT